MVPLLTRHCERSEAILLPLHYGSNNSTAVKDGDGPVVEPPVKVTVECAGNPSDDEKAQLAEEIQGRIQRQLRF